MIFYECRRKSVVSINDNYLIFLKLAPKDCPFWHKMKKKIFRAKITAVIAPTAQIKKHGRFSQYKGKMFYKK